MNRDYFIRAFQYDAWANHRALESMKSTPAVSPRARQVLAHIAGAGRVWLTRLRGQSTEGLPIWPELSLDDCAHALAENDAGYAALLQHLQDSDLAVELAYRTSTGLEFRTTRADILSQVLTHGPYHRGQLAAEIKRAGGQPPMTDFILFVRDGG